MTRVAAVRCGGGLDRRREDKSCVAYAMPRLLVLGVAAVWGTNFGTVKMVEDAGLGVSVAAMARFTLAAAALAPGFYAQVVREGVEDGSEFVSSTIGIGLWVSLGYAAQSLALLTTEANKSAFICSLCVVFVPLFERVLFGVRKGPEAWLSKCSAPALAVAGVAMLELGGVSAPATGDAWALLQAVGFAMGFIGNHRVLERWPRLALSSAAMQLATVAVLSTVWAAVDASRAAGALVAPDVMTAFMSPKVATALLYTGLVTTALTVWLENVALVHVSPSEMTVLLSTEPMWASAFSAVLLGEHMGQQAVAGGALILAACLVYQAQNVYVGRVPTDVWKKIGCVVPAGLFSAFHVFLGGIAPPS